jgi:hypothetical protein
LSECWRNFGAATCGRLSISHERKLRFSTQFCPSTGPQKNISLNSFTYVTCTTGHIGCRVIRHPHRFPSALFVNVALHSQSFPKPGQLETPHSGMPVSAIPLQTPLHVVMGGIHRIEQNGVCKKPVDGSQKQGLRPLNSRLGWQHLEKLQFWYARNCAMD